MNVELGRPQHRRRIAMASTITSINWLHDLTKALELAHEQNKPVLLDFFSPH
jgi:hypothetical protein